MSQFTKNLIKRLTIKSVNRGNKLPTRKKDTIQELDIFSTNGTKIKVLKIDK